MKTYLPWIFDSEFILNIHIRIRYSNNYDRIALFVFVFVLILRMNTIRIRIRFIFRKRILFVFVFVPKSLFVPTLFSNPSQHCLHADKVMDACWGPVDGCHYCYTIMNNMQKQIMLDMEISPIKTQVKIITTISSSYII